MKKERSMRSTDNSIYFLAGLGIGAAIGVLCAPKSGSDLRRFLHSAADEAAKSAKQNVAEAVSVAQQTVDELKKGVADTVIDAKEAITTPLANLSSAMEAGKKAYQEAKKASADVPETI